MLPAEATETIFDLAEHLGIDLDALEAAHRRLDEHGRALDAADDEARRARAGTLMAFEIEELAEAFKQLRAAVERGGAA